jgi:LmbE family N-acetylglucosaminyl deacetylase
MNLFSTDHSGRLMLVATHPDDESLGAGILLQEAVAGGAAVRVLFLTSGDNNPWPQRLLERRWRIGAAERARWGARREGEALAALTVLGVVPRDVVFLRFPDQGLTDMLLRRDDRLAARLLLELVSWRPTHLVAPSPRDLHPDHNAAALFVGQAFARLDRSAPKPEWLEYSVHVRDVPDPPGGRWVPSTNETLQGTKRLALCRHESQVALQSRRFLRFADRPEEFVPAPEPVVAVSTHHPVRRATVEQGELVLELAMSAWATVFGRATLYLAADIAGTPGIRAFVRQPRRARTGSVFVRDAVTGHPLGKATVAGGPRRATVRLGLEILGPLDRLFAKIERPYGFFDESGWRELPLARPGGEAVAAY